MPDGYFFRVQSYYAQDLLVLYKPMDLAKNNSTAFTNDGIVLHVRLYGYY